VRVSVCKGVHKCMIADDCECDCVCACLYECESV
jgi:hypothetical protein